MGKSSPLTQRPARIQSVDLLRGAVMVLMAIDHVRVYSGVPPGNAEPAIFFTRWVTHFCAPAFVFLTGTSAFLKSRKLNTISELRKFLISRGVMLILLELTIIRFFWTFNFNFAQFTLAGVIWMLGWCMVLLAAFVGWPIRTIGVIGILMIAIQQIFGLWPAVLPEEMRTYFGWWEFFYPSGLNGVPGISILYVLIPWLGVMMAGYAFGRILEMDNMRIRSLQIGISCIVVFLLAATSVAWLGSADPEMPFLLRVLNQQKYPPSQLYLLMTLGPLIALMPFAQKTRGWLASVLVTFGKVPFFYYLSHILLIHLLSLGVNFLRTGNAHQDWYNTAPFVHLEEPDRWNLPLLYGVFMLAVIILYFACRWYAGIKTRESANRWLQYL